MSSVRLHLFLSHYSILAGIITNVNVAGYYGYLVIFAVPTAIIKAKLVTLLIRPLEIVL